MATIITTMTAHTSTVVLVSILISGCIRLTMAPGWDYERGR
jgi:hypothetical protein